ncbi:MAG: uracil-DNA glycosylase [Nitrospirota bacterium]
MSRNSVERFIRLLKQSPTGAVFNPWWEVDEQNDIARTAPRIRRQQLGAYLQQRLGHAKIAVIGEALGYRGGHFTGIPMTSERILLGKRDTVAALNERRKPKARSKNGAHRVPLQILATMKPRRTSKPTICPDGLSEPTATIVWGALLKIGVLPDQFVLWNAFSWHSFDPQRGLLSNRMPNKCEQLFGRPVLKAFLALFPCRQIVALGKIAAAQLNQLGFDAHCVRHPASGGAKLFREQIARILR